MDSLESTLDATSTNRKLLVAERFEDIRLAASLLHQGHVVVVPTDTLYALSASVLSAKSVERVFSIKRRAPDRAVPILLASAADLPLVASDVPRAAWKIIEAYWPGRVTLVLPARRWVPVPLRGQGNTVAVRVPGARSCLELLEALGEPIVGTSANRSGLPPATKAADVMDQLNHEPDAVLCDDAAISEATASTVVELTDSGVVVHREGAVSADELRQIAGLRAAQRGDYRMGRQP